MQNKPVITYLLGAGASVETMPLVADMADKIKDLNSFINPHIPYSFFVNNPKQFSPSDISDNLESIKKELFELENNCRKFVSIDTYAKKLFLTGNEEKLYNLKIALSIFFLLEQSKKGVDKRYDKFWATILQPGRKILYPINVKILTWNYDNQLMTSLKEYLDWDPFHSENIVCNSVETIKPITNHKMLIGTLNGTAGALRKKDEITTSIFPDELLSFNSNNQASWTSLISYYKLIKNSNHHLNMQFAFEGEKNFTKPKHDKTFIEAICEHVKSTKILVIIGYSLPYFNRIVDKQILNAMRPQKIYIQERNTKRAEEIANKLYHYLVSSDLKSNYGYLLEQKEKYIIPVVDENEFWIPPEFE